MILAVRSEGKKTTQPYLILRKYAVQFSQLVIHNFWSKIIFITVIKPPLNFEGFFSRLMHSPAQQEAPGLSRSGFWSCPAHPAGLGATPYHLGASMEKTGMEKLPAFMFSIFKHSQSIRLSMTFDIKGKAGQEDEEMWEKSLWTPQELDPWRGPLCLAL